MELTQIGKITKPQGVRGEFRLRPNQLEYAHYVDIKQVKINNKTFNVEHISLRNGFVVVKLDNIDDRNTIETMVGAVVYAEMEAKELADNEYYISDVVGCKVIDNSGKEWGEVTAINNYGATDIYTVENGAIEYLFPVARGVIQNVDIANKLVLVDSKVIKELISE